MTQLSGKPWDAAQSRRSWRKPRLGCAGAAIWGWPGSTRGCGGDGPSSMPPPPACGREEQGPRQGSAELSTLLSIRGPHACCSLGCFGWEQPRPLLGSNIQLSHELRGGVVAAMPTTSPTWMKKCGFVCRKTPHLHSVVSTTAHENHGGKCICACVCVLRGVRVYEIREMK